MDFTFSSEEEKFRSEVVGFIDKELPWDWKTTDIDTDDLDSKVLIKQFRKKLAQKGWRTLAWPKEYGGQAAPHMMQVVLNEEMAYHRVLASDDGVSMLGPVLMIHGTEEQKSYFLNRIAQADIEWAQGYSEPDAGSDLASVQTRAVEDGDDFVINGSKIWNQAYSGTDWMFMLVRTDPEAPKHRGISFMLVDMKTPGITVNRIPMMWNSYSCSLVTFDNVRVPKKNLVGEQNRGWYVGAALLDFERSGVSVPAQSRRLLHELVAFCKETKRNGETLAQNPLLRHRLSEMAVEIETSRLMCYNVAWMQSRGLIPNKEASVCKAFSTEMAQRLYGLGMQIMGTYGQLEPGSKWAPLQGRIEKGYLRAFAGTVYSGTSEIQRMIIATRGLGLPRG